MCKTQATVQVLDKLKPADRSDLSNYRNEYLFRTPFVADAMEPLLKDDRDRPMLYLLLNIAEILFPGALIVFYVNIQGWAAPLRHLIGLLHIATIVVLFLERFMLMMHFSSHRTIFHNNFLNSAIVWLYAPMFGVPAGVYKLHHVIMHHIENNHELDASSTEPFQRDSWTDFARYWARFAFGVWIELPYYCLQSKRWEWLKTLCLGLASSVVTVFCLAKYVNFTATFYVFMLPYVVVMSALAFGNWSQHIFINPEDSTSNFGLTYNCLDNPANKRTFNDGYHAVHHLNARLHWSEIPEYFLANKEKHVSGGALTFRGVDFFEVGMLTMTKQLKKLAQYYVHLGSEDTAPTVDEVEAKLRSWLVPIHRDPTAAKAK
mmetsp:Transcript_16402/g.30901  ORF Transcript_16402/g.30901 Transcript_16402/m.30901 type:complete len:375 (+) Transcript_16402:119-1243(+)